MRPPFQLRPKERMKNPFIPDRATNPALAVAYENRYTVLGTLPNITGATQPEKSTAAPFKASSSRVQTKECYKMKPPESYSQAVKPDTPVKKETIQIATSPQPPKWEFIVHQALPIMALDKQYENFKVQDLVKPCFTNYQYVDSQDPLKTRRLENDEEALELLDTASSSGEPSNGDMLAPRVQVAVKPLYRLGLDTPICLLLRDARMLNFEDSLLGVLQSNLARGPVYFNCYPNFSVDIQDENILDTLTLNIKTKNMNNKINTKEIAVIYRVYYRLMKTTLAPKAKLMSNKGVTMLMEANQEHINVFVPRMLRWDETLTKDEWRFDAITPQKVEPEKSKIQEIVQHQDGSVNLKFLRSSSGNSSKIFSIDRASSSKTREEDYDEEALIKELEHKIKGVDFSTPIPKVHYNTVVNPGSPTPSDLRGSLGMIKRNSNFKINSELLKNQWEDLENAIRRSWYVETYPEENRLAFKKTWIADMKRLHCNIEFFRWFQVSGQLGDKPDSLKTLVNKWYTSTRTITSQGADVNRLSRHVNLKNYYPRASVPDMQFEED
ncbi:hypothetical protein K7X08_020182 [Anisodus acutangulus]|uniref:DUF7588 domain-containing protein n=1 Tax=Anisodus acutangulus TaxID=402998 RepID=A0A9Q1RER1_9SOLA|nr:hypothetical protein K7X08_020182 [Anisodus acutangulus]